MWYALKLFWYKIFCPLKLKITQFPNGFRLKKYTQWNVDLSACNLGSVSTKPSFFHFPLGVLPRAQRKLRYVNTFSCGRIVSTTECTPNCRNMARKFAQSNSVKFAYVYLLQNRATVNGLKFVAFLVDLLQKNWSMLWAITSSNSYASIVISKLPLCIHDSMDAR